MNPWIALGIGFVVGASFTVPLFTPDEPEMRAQAGTACAAYGLKAPGGAYGLSDEERARWVDCMHREMAYQRSRPRGALGVLRRQLEQRDL